MQQKQPYKCKSPQNITKIRLETDTRFFIFRLLNQIKSLYLQPIFNEQNMANHKSSIKRIRQTESKKVHNRFQAKTTRTHLKRLRTTTDKKEANELLPKVVSMLDKLAKRNVIHKNKAANLKSKLTKKVKSIK